MVWLDCTVSHTCLVFQLTRMRQMQNPNEHNHSGYAAIENVNIININRSKISGNSAFDCNLSPDWRQMASENTVSSDFLILVRRLLIAFSIAAYLV